MPRKRILAQRYYVGVNVASDGGRTYGLRSKRTDTSHEKDLAIFFDRDFAQFVSDMLNGFTEAARNTRFRYRHAKGPLKPHDIQLDLATEVRRETQHDNKNSGGDSPDAGQDYTPTLGHGYKGKGDI